MHRKAPMTDQEKYEQQLQLEQELGRLAREYTIMERDRKAFAEQSGGKLAKQKKVIRILKNEQKNILTNLNVATAPGKLQQDKTVVKNLSKLLNQFDEFDANIKAGKAHLNEINDQIRQVKKEVADLEAEQITDVQWQNRVLEGQKIVDALENKLDVQIKKFCTIMAQNRQLRQEIDHLLKERAHFNLLWEKLIGNLNQGKKFMLDLIEQATIAYDQREEWCTKLQALRTRAHNDLISHSEEIRELCGKIDKEEKLREFLSVKCQKRIMSDLEQKEMAKRLKQREAMETQLQEYRQMLDNIFEFTGYSQIDVIADVFRKDEEENFAHFKCINQLNREMENLTEDLYHLHLDIDEQKQLNVKRAFQQEDKLKSLNSELAEATKQADKAEAELETKDKKLAQLLAGINRLFKLCKCSNAPLLELLGNNSEINKYNVMLHLEILEKRISDLILMVYYKEFGEVEKRKARFASGVIKTDMAPGSVHTIDKIVATQPCSFCVEHEQVSDVIDVLQIAWDREEVQQKLKQRLQLPDGLDRLHNVSACHLPESRQIIQRRYQ